MVLMAIILPIQVQMGSNFACNLSFTQILYRWCLGIKAWPTDRDRSNFLEMVTGSKGNNNMMLVMEWVVDFVMDFVMVKVVIKGVEE